MKDKRTKDEEFERIYHSCADDVYRACHYLTPDEDLAQEVAQQAFVNFYERVDMMGVQNAKAYLIRSARNILYNYYRDTKKEVKPDEEESLLPSHEPITESVEEQYFLEMRRMNMKELSDEIILDLRENHETWYEVIEMLFFEDMNHDQVAEEIGITKEVLYSRLHRAKLWIRKNYEKEFRKIIN